MNRLTTSASLLLAAVVLAAGGCARQLMETPNLYADGRGDPFDEVPPRFQSNAVEVIYVTDRQRTDSPTAESKYGWGRSGALAFGTCEVRFGKDVSWKELVEASRSRKREIGLPIRVGEAREIGRSPKLPLPMDFVGGRAVPDPKARAKLTETRKLLQQVISERLALADEKVIYLHVHGYKNRFNAAVPVIAQIWHFLGRRGVPVAYTWPAGHPGVISGYAYDRESSEFTVYHFRELLRVLGFTEDVEKVHVIAHSRGTDVAVSAIREMLLLHGGDADAARAAMKLGVLVLAAPDLDLDVVQQTLVADHLFEVPERLVTYVSERDEAITVASRLFRSRTRVGQLRPADVAPDARRRMAAFSRQSQVIDADVTGYTKFGHDYYYSHPAVSSDLVLLLTGHLDPGTEHGRPLTSLEAGFWQIGNDYPQ
ncbi:MAG: alpha/beta hydrolase [Planctomycetota bacterium]|jgi:esterase/lipase superfamily enzyme